MNPDGVKSATRVIALLKAFAQHRQPLSQAALIDATSYPQSSMTSLLKTLTAEGVLHYNARSREYYPTMVVRDLGSWIDDLTPEAGRITSIMQSLRRASGETVALAAQNAASVMYLRSMESDHIVRYHVQAGEQRPLLETSMGWLLLSRQSSDAVERIYRRTPVPVRNSVGDLSVLQSRLDDIRASDHCYLANVPPRAGTVAMLLPAHFNGSPLVIGVGGFIERMQPQAESILATMRRLIEEHGPVTR